MTGTARQLVVRTGSPAETEAVGAALARSLPGAAFVTLEGPLGAGKTVLARGICRELGVEAPVTSPTFTLSNEYEGRGGRRVVHLDCFRLEGARDLEDLGIEDRLEEDTLVLLEWGDRALAALPSDAVRVALEPDEEDEDVRRIAVRLPGGVVPPGLEETA